MKKRFIALSRSIAAFLLVAGGAMLLCAPCPAHAVTRVLVMPFAINAETDLAFLQKGIQDMLTTRLADKEKVVVIDRATAEAAMAKSKAAPGDKDPLALAQGLGADLLVTGSLTVFGESISTDARCIDLRTRAELVTLSEAGGKGDVIQHVNRFASQINEKVFGRATAAKAAPETRADTRADTPGADQLRRNPEELWYSQSGMRIDAAASEYGAPGGTLWKSRKYNESINGIAVGDIDGDGRLETALLGNHAVLVQRYINDQFERAAEFTVDKGLRLIAIDVADINGNGREEIFVTALREDFRLQSLVLEWQPDKKQLKPIAQGLDWYFRVIFVPERKEKVLLGQQSSRQEVFYGDVYELQWIAGSYTSSEKQGAPAKANVFGLAYGDFMQNGQRQVLSFVGEDYLRLTAAGSEEWLSGAQYGGSYTFLVTPEDWEKAQKGRGRDPEPENRYYIPQRLIVADVEGDGKPEVLVVRNDDATNRVLTRVRVFKQGHFECLAWDNVGLTPKWRTRNFSGYISDYAWADIDNDGANELVFVVVASEQILGIGKERSYIVAWNTALEEKAPAQKKP